MRYLVLLPVLLLTLSCQHLPTSPANFPQLSILQGPYHPTQVIVTVVHNRDNLSYSLNGATIIEPVQIRQKRMPHSNWVLETILFKKVPGNMSYTLQVLSKNKIIDQRIIQSQTNRPLQIAAGSCMDDTYDQLQKKQWSNLFSKTPTHLFLIGDNIYLQPDHIDKLKPITPLIIWNRHIENRVTLNLYRQKYLVPTYAIWDDNDYGPSDSDSLFKHKKIAQERYRQFFPLGAESPFLNKGPGISFATTIDRTQFVFLDNRSFRINSGPKKQIFGNQQIEWMMNRLRKKRLSRWLISGGQFFGDHHPFESFSRIFPKKFKAFLARIRAKKMKLTLLTGDRHLFEVQEIPKKFFGYKTYEITTSGLHSKMYKNSVNKYKSPYLLFGKSNEANYILLHKAEQSNHLQIDAYGLKTDEAIMKLELNL